MSIQVWHYQTDPLTLLFRFICCHNFKHTKGMILTCFTKIMKCVKKHTAHHCINFATLETVMSRSLLLKELTKYYNLKFMQPTLHCVPFADGSVVTVPIFNIKSLLLSFLNDPLRIRKENFAPDYDIMTGRAISSITHIDKVHSGSL